tara:strand:+ start:547 stop:999 length:453 start_codon:yes stop_codon:yes gene_type:complete
MKVANQTVFFCFIFALFFLCACSQPTTFSDIPEVQLTEPTEPIEPPSKFSPPSWIQGNWMASGFQNGRMLMRHGYQFQSADIFLIYFIKKMDYGLNHYPSAQELTRSETEYSFQYKSNGNLKTLTCVQGFDDSHIICSVDEQNIRYNKIY